jgi:hypothetical protein
MRTISSKVSDLEYKEISEYAKKHSMTVSNLIRQVLQVKIGLHSTFCPTTGKRIFHDIIFSHPHNH